MHYKDSPKFPDKFMWGASSASWQIEGAAQEDGRTLATIDLNTKTKVPYADDSVASDHYHHVDEDVKLMAECGFTSYRFSLSWPRIVPDDGQVNEKGIAFYNRLIDGLIRNGITPIVTLYHYDMPVWVEKKYGGWHGRGVIQAFDFYVRTCFKAFGDRVKYWLSINEQNMQIVYGDWLGVSKGCADWFREKWEINHIMNLCHAKAVVACHEMVDGGKIGPVPGYVPIYPESCKPQDQIAAMNAEELTEKIWNDLYVYGEYSNFVKRYWAENGIDPNIQSGDMELIRQAKIDFIGVNCYRSNVARHAPIEAEYKKLELNASGKKGGYVFPTYPGVYALVANPYVEKTDWDWEIDPIAMRYSLRYLWDHYHLPMMITENGLGAHEQLGADGRVHDDYRIKFLNDHLYQIGLAIEDGCEVLSYNLWSVMDLLSTGNGMAKRYGLIYVDVTDEELRDAEKANALPEKRYPKDSYYWYQKVIASNGKILTAEKI